MYLFYNIITSSSYAGLIIDENKWLNIFFSCLHEPVLLNFIIYLKIAYTHVSDFY